MDKGLFLTRLTTLHERVAAACSRSNRNPSDVRIVVVTKTHPIETVQTVVDCGIRDIGENRVQELEAKVGGLSGAFEMHLIGHLQTNKVGKVVPLVAWVQSVDSIRLADSIDRAALSCRRRIKVLVQVKTSNEETKSGCAPRECVALAGHIAQSKCLEFCGLMTIGPLAASETETRKAFAHVRSLSEQCKSLCARPELSMGMSSDFEWAIEEGSTMIRVGTLLLGERESR
jgi:pyridoxal phosphate enzyme (YggS family)